MSNSKFKVLTLAVLAAGLASVQKAISEKPEDAAADILLMADEAASGAQAKSDLATAMEANVELTAELDKALEKASQVPDNFTTHTFKSEEDTYGFVFPEMKHKGKVITSQNVVDSAELQKELIEMKSGMIYKKA